MKMYYISYGSNMNIQQMAHRCPASKVVGNGKCYGWKLIFNIHADIVPVEDDNSFVPVVVWEIGDDRDLKNLDVYEGFPKYYIKENIDVVMDGTGETINAMVYVMNENCKGICPPYEGYLQTIIDGYLANGIDVQYLVDALEYSWKNETEHNQYKRKG